jgi:threonine aldolase
LARYDFASDNVAGAMPEVLEALGRFGGGFEPSYGDDAVSARAADLIRSLLEVDAEIWFAASGTAANALTVATLVAPHEAVIAHEHSHLATDETGAPGLFGAGVGVKGLSGDSGRIDPARLGSVLDQKDSPHDQSAAALSLTQATEFGSVYTEAAMGALIGPAKSNGLGVHLDGARLANAVAAGFDPRSIGRLGVDIAVLGGTKAGSTPTEAIALINKSHGRRFGARLKHGGQLTSKARFLAAPWVGMLESGAWSNRAAHANGMARRLAAAMPFPIAHPVEANAVFVTMDGPTLGRLREAGWVAYRFIDGSVRFMCSWATTSEAVDQLAAELRRLA